MSEDVARRVVRRRPNPLLRAGLPLMTLVVVGALGLAQLLQVCDGAVLHARQLSAAGCTASRCRADGMRVQPCAVRPGQDGGAGRAAPGDGRASACGGAPTQGPRGPGNGAQGARTVARASEARAMQQGVTRTACCVLAAQRLQEAIDINSYQNKPVPRTRS
jgi:hypothetical protein